MKTSVFQLIDLDRTLFDTSQFTKCITDEVDKVSPGMGTALDEQFESAYKQGDTFFLLRHLREQYGDVWLEELVARIVAEYGAEQFLLPGFADRLEFASQAGGAEPAWGILTYGDEADQTMKLRVAGLEQAPVLLTDTPDKGVLIASWQREDGTYQLPEAFGGYIVETETIEDDKLRAFRAMPQNALGIWLTKDENPKERIAQEQLTNVLPANDLFASIEILKNF